MTEKLTRDEVQRNADSKSSILRAEDLLDWNKGRITLQEAQKRAEEIRQATEAEARDRRREAIEEGRRAGAEEATKLVAETTATIDRYLAGIEAQVADLVMETLEQIIGRLDDKELLLRAACQAVSKRRLDKRLTLYVAPAEAADLRLRLEQIFDGEDPHALPVVQGDDKLPPGSCVVASAFGFIEAGVEAQLAAVKEGLRAALLRNAG